MLRLVVLCLTLLFFSAPRAEAQYVKLCPTYDTTVLTPGSAAVISDCTLNNGVFGDLLAIMTGEVTCGPLSDAELFLVAGATAPGFPPFPTGANFQGAISAGVLTVSSLVTPSPQFPILKGMQLYDGNSGTGIPVGTTAQVNISITSPAVVSWFGNTLIANQPIVLTTTGALPSPLVPNTPYYVVSPGSTFNISATSGGAAINTTGSQSGTHTAKSILTVTGQIDGVAGGVGHYSVSDSTVTVSSEPMWALMTYLPLGPPPGTNQISRDPLEHLVCQNGKTSIVTMTGLVRNADFSPRTDLFVQIMFSAEAIAGQPSQSATWKNGHILLVVPGSRLGGLVQ